MSAVGPHRVASGIVVEASAAAVAFVAVPVLSTFLLLTDVRLHHWFMLPVTMCGILVSVDLVDWLRGHIDVFDPRGVVGLIGFHFFYLAPVLHVTLDYWLRGTYPSGQWRDALGAMAIVNVIGLVIYRAIVTPSSGNPNQPGRRQLSTRAFCRFGLAAVAVGLGALLTELMQFEGLWGLLDAMTTNRAGLVGWGWLLVVGESFPLLLFAVAVVYWRAALARRPLLLLAAWGALVIAQLVVSGLRGSRNNVVWPVLVGLMLIHYLVREVSRKGLLLVAFGFILFMYVYGLYKGAGLGVLEIARGDRDIADVSAETGRDMPTLLLGDLGRADVQALVLERQRSGWAEPANGTTYIADARFLLPDTAVPDGLRGKVEMGTDALYGSGAYASGIRSSRVYGVTGEAVLNFGPVGGVLSFVVIGVAIRWARQYTGRARASGELGRRLLAPSVCVLSASLLLWDFGNLVWFLFKHVLPLALVVAAALICGRGKTPS